MSVLPPSTPLQIPCCLCGTSITPNGANQCSACLAGQFDLSSILNRGPGHSHTIAVHQCRRCRRYEMVEGGKRWEHADPESPELLRLCLKRIPALQSGNRGGGEQALQSAGVSSIHLVDASWVWTEPHSMRLKVRVTVRAEVGGVGGGSGGGVTIQQRVAVGLVVQWKQCPDCNREYTSRTWHAVVQLRQKRSDGTSRRGLVLLEAALAKNADVRKHVLSVDPTRHGFDFYFLSLMHARLFAQYVSRICPMRMKTTQKLVSTDNHSNTANLKHTVACDVVPLCRDDLIIVDKRVTSSGGGGGGGAGRLSGRLCLVDKVSSVVRLVDASPARSANTENAFTDVHPDKYWRGEKYFRVLYSSTRLVRFVVLDVELCGEENWGHGGGGGGGDGDDTDKVDENGEPRLYAGPQSGVDKYALADVEVVRESDFGTSDETFQTVSHLGNLLRVGDTVLGYDLASSVLPSDAEWSVENATHSGFVLPDVVLVKKVKGGGGGGGAGDDAGDTPDQGGGRKGKGKGGGGEDKTKKSRAKSSGSKKRERRKKKEEKRQRELVDTVARMGFLDDYDGAGGDDDIGGAAATNDDAALRREREAFERELEQDPELARELDAAERVLKEGGEEMDRHGDVDDDGEKEEEGETEKKDENAGEDAKGGYDEVGST